MNGVTGTSVISFVGTALFPTITDPSVILEDTCREWCEKC